MILSIARRELRALFHSPLVWVLAGVLQLLGAWLFLVQMEEYLQVQSRLATLENPPGVTDLVLTPLLEALAGLALLVVPLLTMRTLSEEFRDGTIDLLLSSPLRMGQIVLGTYLALLSLLSLLLALMPLSLLLGCEIDTGRLASGLLGLLLLLGCCAGIGIYLSSLSILSSLTRQPAVAAISTYGALLFLWIVNLAGGEGGGPLFDWLSLSSHYRRLLDGLVFSSDIAYYLLVTGVSLTLAGRRLESRRLQG
ncbi:MAG: ABC transporter permease subunit [Candidatus Sedimenticola endophacoides]